MMMTKKIALVASLALASSFAVAGGHDDGGESNHSVDLDPLATPFGTGGALNFDFESSAETFTFTVPDTAPLWDFSAKVTNIDDISFYDISLSNGTIGMTYISDNSPTPYSTAVYVGEGTGNVYSWPAGPEPVVGYVALVPGDYSLDVAAGGGDFRFMARLSPLSPVPEPSSIALMLGGLGLVGFMAARRRKSA